MKALRILAAVVMLVCCAITGIVGFVCVKEALLDDRAQEAQVKLDEVRQLAETSGAIANEFGDEIAKAESAGTQLKLYGYGGATMIVLALATVILAFAKQFVPLSIVAGAGLAVAIGLVVMFPEGDPSLMSKSILLFYAPTAVAAIGFAKIGAPAKA